MTRSLHYSRLAALTVGLMAILVAAPIATAQTQPTQPPASAKDSKDKDSKDAAKDAKQGTKEATNQTKNDASKDAKNAKDDAKDTARDRRDSAQDNSQRARDANRDSTGDARNQRDLNATGAARDNRDQGAQRDDRNSRDSQYRDNQNRDNRDVQSRDNRDSQNRDQNSYSNRDRGTSSQSTFRASDVRSADIGVWFDRSSRDGLVISDIASKGAITKFGFREGDRIVSVNGHRVNRDNDFVQYLFADDARNGRVKVIVMRDNVEEVVYVEPNLLMDEYSYNETDPLEQFGLVLDDRYDDRIVVWKVIPRSPAYYAGIRAGDVFTTFRGQPVTSRQDFVKVVSNLDAGNVPVQVRRGDRVRDYAVDVPRYEQRTAMRPNVDVERPNERREARIEDRRENRSDNKNTTPVRPRR
jgi:C-terminal processing protease CtpA/Prc